MSETEALLRRYLAAVRMRADLAEILGDVDGYCDARAAEQDATTALAMARAGVW